MSVRAPEQSANPATIEFPPVDEWYESNAARIGRLAETAPWGYAQGHEFATLLNTRANNISNTALGSLSWEDIRPNDERLQARQLLADSFTDTAQFLDVDPQYTNSDMEVILRPLPFDKEMTHTIIDELEATLQAEPVSEDGLLFHTALKGIYLEHEYVEDQNGAYCLGLRLFRLPNHEDHLSQFGYPRQAGYHQLETEAVKRWQQQGDSRALDVQDRRGAHSLDTTLVEHSPRQQEAIGGPTGEYFTTLASRLRENAGRSVELDMLEDQVQQLSADRRHTFTGDTDNRAEQAVRLNVEQAAVSAAAFLAPRESGRMPRNAQLLEMSPHELNVATRSDGTIQYIDQELRVLFGVTRREEPQTMSIGDERIFTLSEPTMFPGVTLVRSWKVNEQGGYDQFEVWLDRD